MVLKGYQIKVVNALKFFFAEAEKQKSAIEKIDEKLRENFSFVDALYNSINRSDFNDRAKNGIGQPYPRVCVKVPTGGGKTLLAIETIREYQNLFTKKRTGLVVWITHREIIYKQTIENLKDKSHIYRQWLDQSSGNRTIILEKGQPLRKQDTEGNLVILMLMIQSAGRKTKENTKVFRDDGKYIDFFPPDNMREEHEKLLKKIPNLDFIPDNLFNAKIVKTSLGNAIRILNPLIIVDEFHTMFTDNARATLDGLNPSMIIGMSATPKENIMNILIEIEGQDLKDEEMIKLDMHLIPPESANWKEMINNIKSKRELLEKKAKKLDSNEKIYIRPIALIQAERTGKNQREAGFVHSEDIREYLIERGIPTYQIAVKTSEMNEIKNENLFSRASEIRYIITKEALKEGWDCSFAYILGIIPNARAETSMTQLVGRILRQPYAMKTGGEDLDESYVYFTKGSANDVLKNIQKGFKNEGLGDLIKNIIPKSGRTGSKKIKTKIKNEILKKYPNSLYLPVWMIKEKNSYRKFSHNIDIKEKLDWEKIEYKKWLKDEILPLLEKRKRTVEYLIDLDNYKKKEIERIDNGIFETSYLSRKITDKIVDNGFAAFDIAKKFISECEKQKDEKTLKINSEFIMREFIKKLLLEKEKQEKEFFDLLIKENKMILGVSADKEIGYSLPKTCEVYPEECETFKFNLFEKSDISSMNSFEKNIADLIDSKENILWWTRNISEKKNWYSTQGWRKNKIRPDFIVAKKNKNNSLELIYIIESKGEHLIDNPDTKYKESVFRKINDTDIKQIKINIIKFELNKKFQFKFIEQGNENIDINKFFK